MTRKKSPFVSQYPERKNHPELAAYIEGKQKKANKAKRGKSSLAKDTMVLKDRLKIILSSAGVFGGLSLSIANISTYSTDYILILVGLLMTTLTLVYLVYKPKEIYHMVYTEDSTPEDREDGDIFIEPRPNYIKVFLSYFFSAMGFSLFLGMVYQPFSSTIQTSLFCLGGFILTLISRYNLKKHRPISIIEDYILHYVIFLGLTLFLKATASVQGYDTLLQVTFLILGYAFFTGFYIVRYRTITHRGNPPLGYAPYLLVGGYTLTLLLFSANIVRFNLDLVSTTAIIFSLIGASGVILIFRSDALPSVKDIV